ncbi:hypothetical protein BCON_0226g00160 [Botryotinia convoluta]|uniref:Uncharacterized protein n=1 Tax=Botryotinia convoluta TaxID=54673 RepID=A0A4Z1HW22_9HELO|nr:hypothetical protein BCON_0226g00160 [Botryotinia convoluta]
MSLKTWPDETYPGCDVTLPECKICIVQYWIYLCGCIKFTCPGVPDISYLPIHGKPEPTTIPKIKCNEILTTCGKKKCVETSRLPKCRECTAEIHVYKCAHLKVKKSHRCEGCRPSKSKYPSSRPELRLVPHNENLYGGMVCENYLDHEECRKKRKELISQKRVPVLSNSQSFQPESHMQLDPSRPNISDATFQRPAVIIQQGPTLPPYHGYQYTYPREREPETQYAHTPVMTSTHESTPSPYGGYGYAGGYPHGQPNPQYIPAPGSAIPPAWGQPIQPLIIEENSQRCADWQNERQREEARFETTLLRENIRPREYRASRR